MAEKTVVLVHGRHVDTVGWETLVWGDGERIGTGPLGLLIAMKKGAQLVFGTGASEKDGLKECEYTATFLRGRLGLLNQFPEFAGYRQYDPYQLEAIFRPILREAHLDTASKNTDQEVQNVVAFARSIGATEIIAVTSPGHNARCGNTAAVLDEKRECDFSGLGYMVRAARSSTPEFCAGHTVIFEHPHRGDDPMIRSPLMPHEVFPLLFKVPPSERMELFGRIKDLISARLPSTS